NGRGWGDVADQKPGAQAVFDDLDAVELVGGLALDRSALEDGAARRDLDERDADAIADVAQERVGAHVASGMHRVRETPLEPHAPGQHQAERAVRPRL